MLLKFIKTSFLFLIIITNLGFAQNRDSQADLNLIKELSSDSLWGRSVFNNGKEKALDKVLDFIKMNSEFKFEVQILKSDTVSINYIKSINLKVNGKPLTIMSDFLPYGTLETATISGKIVELDANYFDESLAGKNVLIEYSTFSSKSKFSKILQSNPTSIFVKANSLSFAPQTYQLPIPIIFVKDRFIKENDKIELESTSYLMPYPIVNARIINNPKSLKKRITFSAHYDHLGVMTDTLIFNGANDNASGVALATSLFIEASKKQIPSSLLLFDAEELGLLGSQIFSTSAFVKDILYLINLDMCASGDGSYGIVGLSSSDSTFQSITKTHFDKNQVSIKYRDNVPNSDHYWFLKKNLNGFYLYSQNGKQPYHSINDDFETLDFDIYKKSKFLLLDLILNKLNPLN